MKIITIVGARPQFVKAAVISRAIRSHSDITEVIVHTGQHYDANMSDVFFEEMDIPKPQYNLDVNGGSHGSMTGKMMAKIEEVLLKEKPDWLLVYGDTNSTLAGALAARKLHIPIAHIEAGLRSFNMKMPEEVNRILTDRISDVLFCPTQTAVDNLDKEGYQNLPTQVELTGDVMYDAALFYSKVSEERASLYSSLNLQGKPFVLGTIHRQENTDDPKRLGEIIEALNEIQKTTPVVVPLHPRTKKIISEGNYQPTFQILDPVGYFDMIELLKGAQLVMTDSGGLQKEAYFFNNPCITLRDETEWVELITSGCNVLAGASKNKILGAFNKFSMQKPDFSQKLYGQGLAGNEIIDALKQTQPVYS